MEKQTKSGKKEEKLHWNKETNAKKNEEKVVAYKKSPILNENYKKYLIKLKSFLNQT